MSKELSTVVPLTPALEKQVEKLPLPNAVDKETVCSVFALLEGIDAKQVKKLKGRREYDEIEGYLNEIPCEVIVRIAVIADALVNGERWSSIWGGAAWCFWLTALKRYPVLQVLDNEIERIRAQARANKALDMIDEIAETAEQDGARVKACELSLRAHHRAFGAKTDAKEGSTRPIIVVNLAHIFGNASSREAVDA